jgi:hypothetical protein
MSITHRHMQSHLLNRTSQDLRQLSTCSLCLRKALQYSGVIRTKISINVFNTRFHEGLQKRSASSIRHRSYSIVHSEGSLFIRKLSLSMSGVKEAGRHTFVGRSEAFEGVDGKITPNIVENCVGQAKELPNYRTLNLRYSPKIPRSSLANRISITESATCGFYLDLNVMLIAWTFEDRLLSIPLPRVPMPFALLTA